MPSYNRTAGRQLANRYPAWRQAMTETNRLYPVTTNRSDDTPSMIVWRGGTRPRAEPDMLPKGYGGAVHLTDVGGPFGTLVFGGTGEDTFNAQLISVNVSADAPAWGVWNQPDYPITEAQCIAEDSDCYYNEADWTALAAAQPTRIMVSGPGMHPSWDGGFPVGGHDNPALGGYQKGWIWIRKSRYCRSNRQPFQFRYQMPAYIPPSMTGTGAGAILINTNGFSGPFRSNTPNLAAGQNRSWWAQDVWTAGGDSRKCLFYAQNVATKEWTRLPNAFVPELISTGFTTLDREGSWVDVERKRVWYHNYGQQRQYYIDFSNGLSGAVASAVQTNTATVENPAAQWAIDYDSAWACVQRQPGARRLWYYMGNQNPGDLAVIDLDANVQYLWRDMPGFDRPAPGFTSGGYDPVTNRVFFTQYLDAGNPRVYCHSFVVPSDPFNKAAYSCSTVQLAVAPGAELIGDGGLGGVLQFGSDRGKYHPDLGVIFVTNGSGKLLAYRPA